MPDTASRVRKELEDKGMVFVEAKDGLDVEAFRTAVLAQIGKDFPEWKGSDRPDPGCPVTAGPRPNPDSFQSAPLPKGSRSPECSAMRLLTIALRGLCCVLLFALITMPFCRS